MSVLGKTEVTNTFNGTVTYHFGLNNSFSIVFLIATQLTVPHSVCGSKLWTELGWVVSGLRFIRQMQIGGVGVGLEQGMLSGISLFFMWSSKYTNLGFLTAWLPLFDYFHGSWLYCKWMSQENQAEAASPFTTWSLKSHGIIFIKSTDLNNHKSTLISWEKSVETSMHVLKSSRWVASNVSWFWASLSVHG